MALIKCPECGREISSKALSCPHCGNPINMRQEIPVNFTRISKMSGAACKFVIYVDGMIVGQLKNGESFTTSIMQGGHQLDIEAVNPFGKSACARGSFTVSDDAKEVDVEVTMGLAGPTIKSVTAI